MTEKLKPCPFCAGKAKHKFACGITVVWCQQCFAQIQRQDDYEEGDSVPRAIDAWNERENENTYNAEELIKRINKHEADVIGAVDSIDSSDMFSFAKHAYSLAHKHILRLINEMVDEKNRKDR